MAPALDCFAVAAPGLEPLVAEELAALGLAGAVVEGGVEVALPRASLPDVNRRLGIASRLLVRLGGFHARTFPELERHAARLDWGSVIVPQRAVAFRVTSRKSRLYHQGGIAERLGRVVAGAVDGVQAVRWPADDAPDDGAVQRIIVRVFRDEFTVSADSSGALLSRRGYRLASGKAPVRETLAAAMLRTAGYNGTTPLVDPFCGSGTIAIEGACIALGRPPGALRSMACDRWPGLSPPAPAAHAHAAPSIIAASDRDAGAIAATRQNAERAEVSDAISVREAALSAVRLPGTPGHLVTNPPHGIRIGEHRRLRDLYAALGNLLRAEGRGWSVHLLTPHADLARATGLPLHERFRTPSGGTWVQCWGGVVD